MDFWVLIREIVSAANSAGETLPANEYGQFRYHNCAEKTMLYLLER